MDEGTLRDSLKVRTRKLGAGEDVEATLGPRRPAHHAHLVEHGTRRMPPKPYMRPALELSRDEMRKIVVEELRKSIRRVAKRRGLL